MFLALLELKVTEIPTSEPVKFSTPTKQKVFVGGSVCGEERAALPTAGEPKAHDCLLPSLKDLYSLNTQEPQYEKGLSEDANSSLPLLI